MANVYARVSKISNVVGRADYLTDKKRQEEIVLSKIEMEHTWEEHSRFELVNKKSDVKNNEALEVHFALPNDLYQDKKKLERVCDDMAKEIVGENKDYQYAVHWNHDRTNLHCHILFSERENQQELVPKIYKKDQWRDKDTNKLAKANSENAYLYARKGNVQKDKEGNIKYETDIFTVKDIRYIQRNYPNTLRIALQGVLMEQGYNLSVTDKNSPYIAQKKLYKGASDDYIDKAKAWNKEVKQYNQAVKRHIEIEPIQEERYIEIKRELVNTVKTANSQEKKITAQAIDIIKDMAIWVMDTVNRLTQYLQKQAREKEILQLWNNLKDKFSDMFSNYQETENELKQMGAEYEKLDKIDNALGKIIDGKNEHIEEIELQQRKERRKERGWDMEL